MKEIKVKKAKLRTSRKQRVLKHLGKVSMALVYTSFVLAPSPAFGADATDAAASVIGTEGGKQVINEALKVTRGKPALSLATLIVCGACIPAAGVAASPGMCIACGILVAKLVGV
jgi:hypothetical protein